MADALKIDDVSFPDQFRALVEFVEQSFGALCSISVSPGREPDSYILDALPRAPETAEIHVFWNAAESHYWTNTELNESYTDQHRSMSDGEWVRSRISHIATYGVVELRLLLWGRIPVGNRHEALPVPFEEFRPAKNEVLRQRWLPWRS